MATLKNDSCRNAGVLFPWNKKKDLKIVKRKIKYLKSETLNLNDSTAQGVKQPLRLYLDIKFCD